jgi:cytochrome P450
MKETELPRELSDLTHGIMQHVVDYYRSGEPARDRVFECMNALAIVAATVIAGTDDDMRVWFFTAVDANVHSIRTRVIPAGEPEADEVLQ